MLLNNIYIIREKQARNIKNIFINIDDINNLVKSAIINFIRKK
jgi:hypothetical protein